MNVALPAPAAHVAPVRTAPTRTRASLWPIAIAMLLAMALHVRLLYRSPGHVPRAPAAHGSIAVRMVQPQSPADSKAPPEDARAIANATTPATRLTLATPQPASAPSPAAEPPAPASVPRHRAAAPAMSATASNAGATPASSAALDRPAIPPTIPPSMPPSIQPWIAPSIVAGAHAPAFSMGRLFDFLGIPLEAGNTMPDRAYTGANSLPPAPDYLDDQQYETGPQARADIALVYPEQGAGRSGTVLLRLLIGEGGAVDDVGIIKATPPDVFDDAAIAAFKVATFEPALVRGAAVKSQITIEVEFAPSERDIP